MNRRHSIFRRYLQYFVVVLGIALLATGSVNLLVQYQTRIIAIDNMLDDDARAARDAIQGFLEHLVNDIRHHTRWTRWPFHPGGLQVTRLEFILLLRNSPAITDLLLLDAHGREQLLVSRLAMDRIDGGRDLSKRPAFTQSGGDQPWFGPVYYRKETEPYMDIALRSGDGDQATVAVATVNLRFLWDRLSTNIAHHHSYAYVVDHQGQLIAHPDLSKVLAGTRADRLPQVRRTLHQDTRSPSDTVTAVEGYDFSGQRVLSRAARVDGPNWLVFAEQARDAALAPLTATLMRGALMLLLGLGLALVAGFLLARHMSAPIGTLQRGVEAFARGDLDHRIHLSTGDELETLADACNRMAQQIRGSHRDLEQKVRERTRAADTANRHKTEFLAHLSHELRTPLNAVMGFSEALEMRLFGELNAKQAEYVHNIHESGKHLLQLINDVLDLARVEAGELQLELIALDVDETLRAAAMLVRGTAAKRGIELTLEIAADLPRAQADKRKLKQIIINLLSNALKYTPRDGRVSLQAYKSDTEIVIACHDTGIGIAASELGAVFDKFHQVRTQGEHKPEGTGLGLALTRRLVEAQGGKITVESRPGSGSTFSFTLPCTA